MLFILIASALVVVVAVLGLSICRVAALSDRNSALALTEWLAASRRAERHVAPPDRAGEQFRFDPSDEAFRAAGWR
jgi:Tfp pilus assembly protein PilX